MLLIVSLALVSLHARAYTKVSPIDEQMHIDYMYRAPSVQPVVSGTRLGPEAMREEACRGIDSAFTPPPCGSPTLRAEQFQESGYNTAYINPATYYDLTALLAHPLQVALGLSSLVTAGRLVGALWLWLGLVITMLVARRLGASLQATVGLLLMAASTPNVLFFSATVSPDSMNLLVGAAVLSLVLAWETKPARWWLLVLAAAVGVLVKTQGAIVVLMMGLYLGARAFSHLKQKGIKGPTIAETSLDPQVRPRELFVGLLALGTVAVTLGVGWLSAVGRNATLRPELLPMNLMLTHQSSGNFVQDITGFFPPLGNPPLPAAWDHSEQPWLQILSLVLVGGTLFWVLFRPSRGPLTSLASAVTLACLTGPALFYVMAFVQHWPHFPIPTRYGMTLLPAMVVVTAVAVRHRYVAALLIAAGVLSCLTVGVRLGQVA